MKLARPEPPKFLDLLEDTYLEEDKKAVVRTAGDYRHNPSSATMVKPDGTVAGACIRALYYKATSEPVSDPKEFTTRLQAGFGNGIHDYLASQLKKSDKIKYVSEVPGKMILNPLTKEISFRLDGLATYKGEQGCVEIKTMQSYGLNRMVKEGGPKEAHILQVLCYFGTNPDLRWTSLVYFGRDNAYRAEYHIYKDPESDKFVLKGITPAKAEVPIDSLSFDKVVERWKDLEGYVERGELPKRDYKAVLTKDGLVTDKRVKNAVEYKTDYACLYCPWQSKCWSLPDAQAESRKVGN